MKILISIILISIGLMEIYAQTTKPEAQLSPALQEAAKLNGEVVKLFGQKNSTRLYRSRKRWSKFGKGNWAKLMFLSDKRGGI